MNALKEQLASAKTIPTKPSGEQINNKMADCEQQTLDLISRNNIEGELALKDKEVSRVSRNGQGTLNSDKKTKREKTMATFRVACRVSSSVAIALKN